MILAIMSKVKPQALLLCSIISIGNHRLEQLAIDKCHSIDLSLVYPGLSHELLFGRFYSHVLPRICNTIQSMTISFLQLLRIDAAVKAIGDESLPNLRHLKISAGRRCINTGTPFTISKSTLTFIFRCPL